MWPCTEPDPDGRRNNVVGVASESLPSEKKFARGHGCLGHCCLAITVCFGIDSRRPRVVSFDNASDSVGQCRDTARQCRDSAGQCQPALADVVHAWRGIECMSKALFVAGWLCTEPIPDG